MLAEVKRDPSLIERYQERLSIPRREKLYRILNHARETGQMRADVDFELPIRLLTGFVLSGYVLFGDQQVDRAMIRNAVETTVAALR